MKASYELCWDLCIFSTSPGDHLLPLWDETYPPRTLLAKGYYFDAFRSAFSQIYLAIHLVPIMAAFMACHINQDKLYTSSSLAI